MKKLIDFIGFVVILHLLCIITFVSLGLFLSFLQWKLIDFTLIPMSMVRLIEAMIFIGALIQVNIPSKRKTYFHEDFIKLMRLTFNKKENE